MSLGPNDPHSAGESQFSGPPPQQAPYGQAPHGQAPYGQAPYGQAPYGQAPSGPPPQQRRAGTGAIAIVMAILFWPVGLLVSIVVLARSKKHGGKGMGIAGLIISLIFLVVSIWVFMVTEGPMKPQDGAAQAVIALNESIVSADCDAFMSATSEAFRGTLGAPDCAAFAAAQPAWVAGHDDYATQVLSSQLDESVATVSTRETFTLDGVEQQAFHTYRLIREGGAWCVDGLVGE